jgi:hypothetical protein
MERKTFLATAAGIGASIAAVSAALGAPVPAPVGSPTPNGTMAPRVPKTYHRNAAGSNRNIREIRKHLEHVIDELQHDQHDYAGHRVKALDLLNQARNELLLAEQADTGK